MQLYPLWAVWEKALWVIVSKPACAFPKFRLTDSGVLPPRSRDTSPGRRVDWTGVSVYWCFSPEMKKTLALLLAPCQYRSVSSGSRKAGWGADGAAGFSVRNLKRWQTVHHLSITLVVGRRERQQCRILDSRCWVASWPRSDLNKQSFFSHMLDAHESRSGLSKAQLSTTNISVTWQISVKYVLKYHSFLRDRPRQ